MTEFPEIQNIAAAVALKRTHRGVARAVAAEMRMIDPRPLHQTAVDRWLRPLMKDRTEPVLSTGLVLAAACRAVVAAAKAGRLEEKP